MQNKRHTHNRVHLIDWEDERKKAGTKCLSGVVAAEDVWWGLK